MNEKDLGFDTEFMSDEEVEAMLDGIVNAVGECVKDENRRTSIINPYRIQMFIYTYKMLKFLCKGTKSKVTYELHEPYTSMGVVSVTGKELVFRKPEWFVKAVEFASNIDVYPKTDGTVQIDFTFHGLTNAIE